MATRNFHSVFSSLMYDFPNVDGTGNFDDLFRQIEADEDCLLSDLTFEYYMMSYHDQDVIKKCVKLHNHPNQKRFLNIVLANLAC